jgi:uroporphyrin-III C-methyltransferase
VTFATAYRADSEPDWAHLAGAQTLVLFMAASRLAEVTQALMAAGRSPETPAAVVEAGTWAHQRVAEAPLASIAARARDMGLGSPALLVVGEVVALRSRLRALVDMQSQAFEPETLLKVEAGHE